MNVFQEFVQSIKSANSYPDFLKNRKRKVFLYAALLLFLYFIMTILIPLGKFQAQTGGLKKIVVEYIPDFELKDGTLWVESPIYYEDDQYYFDIDSDPSMLIEDIEYIEDFIRPYSSAIVADQEKMIIKNNGQTQMAYYSELEGSLDFSRTEIMEIIPMVNVLIGIGVILLYVWELLLFFLGVVFVALIALIVASAMKIKVTFGQIILMGVYSRTLPLLIKGVLSLIGFHIPFFWLFNFGISVAYLCVALQKVKDRQDEERERIEADQQYGWQQDQL